MCHKDKFVRLRSPMHRSSELHECSISKQPFTTVSYYEFDSWYKRGRGAFHSLPQVIRLPFDSTATMRSRTTSAATTILQERDILSAPLATEHKHLVLRHFHRLRKILDEPDEDATGRYTSKQAGREQFARMTLVFRDYIAAQARGEIDSECESMVADIIDASFYVAGREHTFSQPAFTDPLLLGREHEIASLVQ